MAELGTVVALIKSMSGADPAVIEQAVQAWLDDHPEATTTVQDGSITEAKLAQDVLADLGEIDELKEAIEQFESRTIVERKFQADEMVNAIWSTSSKEININFKYGLSNINKIFIGKTGSIKIKCPGYYIRAFRFPASGTTETDWTDYIADQITLNGTSTLVYGSFTVRKTASSQSDLTSEEMADILSKLVVEECASVGITNCAEKIADVVADKDVTPTEWRNSIFSTTTGKLLPVQNSYKYALSNENVLPIRQKAKISCPGYGIRAFRISADGSSFDYVGYFPNAISIEPTATLVNFGFSIRKNPDSSSALTDAEIADIKSKVSVKIQSTKTDGTMKEIGIPADAYYVGNILNNATNNNLIIGSPRIYHSTNPQSEDYENTDFTDVYDAYDALCIAYPHWIQKQTDIGADADENPIRLYKLRLFDPIVGEADEWSIESETKVNYWQSTFKYRKALLLSGVHGNERCAVWGLLYFITDLLASNDEWATFIKGNYELDIIPIIDPWGYDNKSRDNKNGVNINRDYLSAEKQPETQAVVSYIQANKNDLYCIIDCHAVSGNYGYVSSRPENKDFSTIMRVANAMFGAIADDLATIATSIGISSTCYPYMYGCMSENDGTLVHYCAITDDVTNYAVTLETPHRTNTDGGLVTKYINEGLGNLLQGFLSIFKIV